MVGRILVKWVMIASNIFTATLMLVILIGSVLSPAKFVLPAYCTLIFPAIILVNIGFVVFWLLARKCLFLLSLSLLIFSISEINNTFPVHLGNINQRLDTTSGTFKLLSYNTKMCGDLKKHTPENHNKVIQYAIDSNADVICLQEFTVSSSNEYLTMEDINKAFAKYPYKHIQFRQKDKKENGVATFSKFPIVSKQKINYPSAYNNSILSDININGKIVRVINNHLESNRLTEYDKAMPAKLKNNWDTNKLTRVTRHFTKKLGSAFKITAVQADTVASVIANSTYKVIVCGDFNDVPSSYVYTKVKGSLKDAFAETGTGLGWTFNERYYHFRIDYVFFDPTAYSIIDYKTDKVKYSDHYPVLCQIKIKNN
jgi:endonuclease/exonuclease/phosphatase family metal-dependent hydrolase